MCFGAVPLSEVRLAQQRKGLLLIAEKQGNARAAVSVKPISIPRVKYPQCFGDLLRLSPIACPQRPPMSKLCSGTLRAAS